MYANMLWHIRKYGANPDYIDTQSTERKHKESVKVLYVHTSKRKNEFAEEVANGYAKRLKFELLYEAFHRWEIGKKTRAKTSLIGRAPMYRKRLLSGHICFVGGPDVTHSLLSTRQLSDLIEEYLTALGWSFSTVSVHTLTSIVLEDGSRISFTTSTGLLSAVLKTDKNVDQASYVR